MPFDVSMKDSYHMKDFDFYFNSREHISFPKTQIRYLRVAFTLSNKLIIRNIVIKRKDPDNKFTFHVSLLFLIAGMALVKMLRQLVIFENFLHSSASIVTNFIYADKWNGELDF